MKLHVPPRLMLPETNNRAFKSAFRKGFISGFYGYSIKDCPYGDQRTWYGGVTFARAFWRYWEEGFKQGLMFDRERKYEHQKAEAALRKKKTEAQANDMPEMRAADVVRGPDEEP